ncbi:MAG: polysaccharide biosynthesis protein [Candidatus Limivivens sp.]|nr:polysaccharide biosynthesis protein [Candidatus Limivivens sp.]
MGNKSKNSKNYLVQGTILVAASFIARIIGMIYRIPLTNILGDDGIAYYSTANEIYNILLMVSTFSLPLAISRLVSERLHTGQAKNAHKVFVCSMKFAVIAGAVMSILTFLLAGIITDKIMGVAPAALALRVLSPAIFLFAIAGAFRGFFQGHETMVPTATSQVIEQIVNAVVSVAGAGVMVSIGTKLAESTADSIKAPAYGAAGGTFGTVVSIAVALVFLAFVYISYQRTFRRHMRRDATKRLESDRAIYYAIIVTIVPVVLSTLVYNIGTILDQGIFNNVLASQGYSEKQYSTIWGIYTGKYRVLMNVPLSIASCLSPSVVPALTSAMADQNYREAATKVRDSIRYTMIITIPCAVGMAALASPIMQLIFGDGRSLTAGIMQQGALLIVLLALSTLTTGILQGLGEMKKPLYNAAFALAVHILTLYLFLRFLKLNIYSVIYANTIFALIICLLNAMAIRRCIPYRQELKRTFLIPLAASGIMGVAAYGVYRLFALFAGNAISCLLGILAGVFVYAVLLVKFRGMTESEILSLPKGTMLVNILKKCRIL